MRCRPSTASPRLDQDWLNKILWYPFPHPHSSPPSSSLHHPLKSSSPHPPLIIPIPSHPSIHPYPSTLHPSVETNHAQIGQDSGVENTVLTTPQAPLSHPPHQRRRRSSDSSPGSLVKRGASKPSRAIFSSSHPIRPDENSTYPAHPSPPT